jgi:hypothetical protein
MNVLLGVFMFTMSELDSFYCFNALLTARCPRYVTPTLQGVHHACRLLWRLLELFDAQLHAHLKGKVDPLIFAFAPCMTFMASLKPLDEVMRLWDLLLALGMHFGVIFYATHLIVMKKLLMHQTSPYRYYYYYPAWYYYSACCYKYHNKFTTTNFTTVYAKAAANFGKPGSKQCSHHCILSALSALGSERFIRRACASPL